MIEVDFLPIGEEVKTGDAILLNFTEPGTQTNRLVLIDGGFKDTSDDIIAHVKKYYGRDSIDLVVCTHPDDDHINGLSGVIEGLTVHNLVIHRPSEHGFEQDEVKASKVDDLIELAEQNGVNVHTDFWAGATFYSDAIAVAGPTKDFYLEQLGEQVGIKATVKAVESFVGGVVRKIVAALRPRGDDPGEGTWTDNGGTTARNNSSIVLDVNVDDYRLLFTGDAGVPALNAAADTLQAIGRSTKYPNLFDIPHHGSRHNLDTATATRLLGPIVGDTGAHQAIATVGLKADDFPRPQVANGVKRRGYHLAATRGKVLYWSRNAPDRDGFSAVEPLSWLEVED